MSIVFHLIESQMNLLDLDHLVKRNLLLVCGHQFTKVKELFGV